MAWTVTITIHRKYGNRENAGKSGDAVVDKLDNKWEIRQYTLQEE